MTYNFCFCWECRDAHSQSWFWTTKKNQEIHIFDMEFYHILNSINFIENKNNYKSQEIYNKLFCDKLNNNEILEEYKNHVLRYKNLKFTYYVISKGYARFYKPTFKFVNRLGRQKIKTCHFDEVDRWNIWYGEYGNIHINEEGYPEKKIYHMPKNNEHFNYMNKNFNTKQGLNT